MHASFIPHVYHFILSSSSLRHRWHPNRTQKTLRNTGPQVIPTACYTSVVTMTTGVVRNVSQTPGTKSNFSNPAPYIPALSPYVACMKAQKVIRRQVGAGFEKKMGPAVAVSSGGGASCRGCVGSFVKSTCHLSMNIGLHLNGTVKLVTRSYRRWFRRKEALAAAAFEQGMLQDFIRVRAEVIDNISNSRVLRSASERGADEATLIRNLTREMLALDTQSDLAAATESEPDPKPEEKSMSDPFLDAPLPPLDPDRALEPGKFNLPSLDEHLSQPEQTENPDQSS
ncbi:hypothetical protein M011DRAFT_458462 [Sporormia fimetaria CBS 119925]|uniref:Uncharacterized protein n=1 Tax=Sporormia fimetaria CBS 119925 TaxID=1340428 RepID=A0A6A6VEM8_9PLEO|nr:hypothetical protein M011DRAFT_458462 [Sporormia fimetaria CBS 119925]